MGIPLFVRGLLQVAEGIARLVAAGSEGEEAMSWYRCPCGFIKEESPRFGGSIVSVNHLHRSVRLDGSATIVRMEEVSDATPRGSRDPEGPDSRHAAPNAVSRPHRSGGVVPNRRAA